VCLVFCVPFSLVFVFCLLYCELNSYLLDYDCSGSGDVRFSASRGGHQVPHVVRRLSEANAPHHGQLRHGAGAPAGHRKFTAVHFFPEPVGVVDSGT